MGIEVHKTGQVQEALPMFKNALKANPKIEQFWLRYINVCVRDNQFKDT